MDTDEPLDVPDPLEPEEISPEFILEGEATPPPEGPRVAAPAPVASSAASPAAGRPAPQPSPRPAARVDAPSAPLPAAPLPDRRPAERSGSPLLAGLLFLVLGAGGGFFAGMLWERQAAGRAAEGPARSSAATAATPAVAGEPAPAPEAKRATKPSRAAKPARTAAAASRGMGKLELTAPPAAEVFLDGRRIGKGSMRIPVAAGSHRIEVKVGQNRVGERFEVEPDETWTYEVTSTR